MMGRAQSTGIGVPEKGGHPELGERLVLIDLSNNESEGKHLGQLCRARWELEAEMPPFLEVWPWSEMGNKAVNLHLKPTKSHSF